MGPQARHRALSGLAALIPLLAVAGADGGALRQAVLWSGAQAPEAPSGGLRKVLVYDSNRLVIDDADAAARDPYRAIGRVDGGGGVCTGGQIGRRLVLTNAHCAVGDDGRAKAGLVFKPRFPFAGGRRIAVAQAVVGDQRRLGDDIAVLVLGEDAGDAYLDWLAADNSRGQLNLMLPGYSNDIRGAERLSVDPDCNMGASIGVGWVFHNCNMTPGASGGPLLARVGARWVIVAINRGWNATLRRNEAVEITPELDRILARLRARHG